MKKAIIGTLVLLFLVAGAVFGLRGASAQDNGVPEAMINRIRELLQKRDLPAYLEMFAPELRAVEREQQEKFFGDLKITDISLRTAGVKRGEAGLIRVFLQAFYQNAHTALIESWTLTFEKRAEAWVVVRKDVTGTMTTLYKVRIPSERSERARRVEVTHQDIRIAFTDAAVFYDNVPGLETALVIVGKGTVDFSPSDPNEQHQLELLYKKRELRDDIDSLFVRCSSSLFASNIVIERDEAFPEVSSKERDRAAAVFSRNYSRSFTIENSFGGGLLSFLPQGDEAVLEFKARKAGEMTYVYYPFSDDEVSLFDDGKDRIVSLYSPERAAGPPLKKFYISFEEKFDIQSYALDLSYTPATSFLSAKARIEVVPKVDLLDCLKLRFNPDLEILKILDAENRELFYTRDKLRKLLYVYLISPPAEKAPAAIEVYYRGRMSPAVPTTDVIGQVGLNKQIRFTPRFETYFFSHAGYWYPGPAEEDYFQARLTLIIPPEYSCVANGALVSKGRWDGMDDVVEIEKTGNAVYTFESRSPVKYMSFIVGRLERLKGRAAGPVPLELFASAEVLDRQPGLTDQAADILDFYDQAFGPFPYEKLGIVLRSWPAYGGHSPASFVVLNEVPWHGDTGFRPLVDTPVDLSQWEGYFLAHEIAHQWWGQGVSFESYKDQWLSEGLSQFAAASYLRRKYGENSFAAVLRKFARWTEKKSFRGPIIMGSRLSYYDFEAYQAIVYNKAALALFMLQDLIGKESFDAGLRAFFEMYKFRAARTGQFIAAMEAASGQDLKEFFKGWFFSYELPEVQTTWTETPVPDGIRLDIHVTQVRGRFVFPLWVEWSQAGQTRRHMIVVDETNEKVSLTLPRRPEKVRINPEKEVPGKFYY
ncbi:MAG: M1 family aminopeptidase [Candidatus Aminicenantes bacterium]|nr:M1 family aminopeptidase [Candidatus Aminicenantes bacterium]